MRYNQYTLNNMAMYCIHANSFMAFTVWTNCSLQKCKTTVATVVHIALCIKACSFSYYTVKLFFTNFERVGFVTNTLTIYLIIKYKPGEHDAVSRFFIRGI